MGKAKRELQDIKTKRNFRYMIRFILIIAGLLITINSFGTAQVPDLIIYKGDTLILHANPLESYYNEDNPRPNHFYVSGFSTACWRGYQAIWEIKDNQLYLNAIQDCHLDDAYKITERSLIEMQESNLSPEIIEKLEKLKGEGFSEWYFTKTLKKKIGRKNFKQYGHLIFKFSKNKKRKAPLKLLFKDLVVDGMVHAYWFTGDLKVPKGKMLRYVHMGYMSTYEKEIILEIEKGILLDSKEYDNAYSEIKKGFGTLKTTTYSILVPLDLIPNKKDYHYTSNDTINYLNDSGLINISALSKFNDKRKENSKRIELVEHTIDSISKNLTNNYSFSDRETQKLRWGTACWLDGISKNGNEQIRILTISNINSQVIIIYKEKEIKYKDFEEKADYMTHSVCLMEYGF